MRAKFCFVLVLKAVLRSSLIIATPASSVACVEIFTPANGTVGTCFPVFTSIQQHACGTAVLGGVVPGGGGTRTVGGDGVTEGGRSGGPEGG